MHRWLSLFLVLLIASPATSAQMRRWTGLNGKSIEGRLHRLQKDKVTFLTADGKLVTVALANLIEADRKRLTESPDNPQETSGFKQLPQADRSKIPELSSENLETPAMGSPAEALWISLLWWDATGVLPLPEKALKSKDPAAWLHEEILKVMHNGEKWSGITSQVLKRGLEKYFLKYYANTATVRFTEKYNISGVLIADGRTEMRRLREEYKTKPRPGFPPREITALCQGNDAVIVKLKMLLDDKKIISPHVVFESMTENGDFVFHAFGRRFSGKVRQENGGEAELVLSPSSPLPEKYAKRGARVFLGYESWIWAAALRPYVYAIPGKPVPVPQEFITPPPEEPDTLPLDFSQPGKPGDFPIREWKLTNGNLFSGRFTGIDASGNYILEGTNRQRIAIDLSEIAKDQRTELFCSAACLQTMPVDSLEIRYRATPPKGKPSEFTISTQGLLGRIDDAEEKMKFIFDLSDRSFILTTRQVNGGQETMTTFIGKFGTHEMFGFRGSTTPRWNRDLLPWETLESFAKNSAAQSALSFQDKWPTRSHLLRVAEHSEGYRIDSPIHLNYISINPPTALVALESRLLLHPPVDHHKIPFSIPRMGANQSLNTLRGFFVSSRMLPLRLQWNVSAPNDPKLISSHVGPYSVEATELRINPSFPSDHFTIPAESRAMQEGTAILVH